jgi:flavin-dependent dehydrogenase
MKYDVSVIGAGPAGLAAAIECARAGLRVCVLERSQFPRDCVGESVHPGAEPLFEQLGVSSAVAQAGFLRYPGITIVRDGKKEFHAFGGTDGHAWQGFHLWRPQFDEILQQRAKSAGAVCFERCRLSRAEVIRDKVTIQSNLGPVESFVVIDGTGRRRWLTEQWNLAVETHSPLLIARFGYQEGICETYPDGPVFIWRKDGWDWIARLRADLYQWISLAFANTKAAHNGPPVGFRRLPESGRVRGADVTWRLVPNCAGRHHFLVGDACAVLDPSSSHGILRGLASGILAAACVREILMQGFCRYDEIAERYSRWQRQWFQRDASILRRLRDEAIADSGFLPRTKSVHVSARVPAL